jgi:serine/threonine-protein kinase
MSNDTSYDTVLGKLAVELGLCTEDELKNSFKEQLARSGVNPVVLPNVMVDLGYLTSSQVDRLKSKIKETRGVPEQIPGYHIIGKLGKGAMAVVYKAKQISLDRIVAIKILPKRFTENPEYVTRFYKEGKAAAKLNHNNIVQAIDVGEAGGYHYFVMEYVEGKSIYDDLAAGKVFSEQEALDIVIQVAKALEHAHNNGLIHRDVKPKNIMINKEGVVKLADMGLARETSDIEAAKNEAGRAYGTPYYISPEQIRGEIDIDGRADIYGLGATFYHMVTGRVPFVADDPSDVMRKHLREELVPPDHINTSLSNGVSEVIEVMMAKRREERYNNAEELLADLNAVRAGQLPLQAHDKFDVSMLEKLEDGGEVQKMPESIDIEQEKALTNYRIVILMLSLVAAASIIGLIILTIKSCSA